jgi:hypothetical protein
VHGPWCLVALPSQAQACGRRRTGFPGYLLCDGCVLQESPCAGRSAWIRGRRLSGYAGHPKFLFRLSCVFGEGGRQLLLRCRRRGHEFPTLYQNLSILTTVRRGDYPRHILQALSHRSRLEEPAASPALGLDGFWRGPVGSGITGWLMTVIAGDAHLSLPLLSATSCAIFVNS